MRLPDLPPESNCCVCVKTGVCVDADKRCSLCFGDDGFQEKGQQVKLKAKSNEQVKAIVLDGCLLSDDSKKSCDGLFLFCKNNKTYILLIELKGTHIEDAFEQLACVKYEHQEYKNLCRHIKKSTNGQIIEKCFVITNGAIGNAAKAKLEKFWRIKVRIVTQQKTRRDTVNLRNYLGIDRGN